MSDRARTFRRALAPFALLAATAFCAGPAATAALDDQQAVDAIMHAYDGHTPGATVLVMRDDVAQVRRGYGFANLEEQIAATPATNYRLASMTKQFTAAAILLLAETGRLGLDDRIRRWLPSLPDTDNAITIRHLLTHRGGLIDYEDVMPDSESGDRALGDLSRQLRDIDVLHLLERERRVYFTAGSAYRYSNGGYSMLALIVERAGGQSFQSFLHDRIFQPLGMHHTLAYVREGPPVPTRAYGYTETAGVWQRTDQSLSSAVLGDGGVYSSIDDLAKWDAALYDNRLLSEASRRLAFTPWTKTDEPAVEYGFGWRISGETVWHSGETIGFRNVILRYPRRHLSVIILTNRNDLEPYRAAVAIAQRYLQPRSAEAHGSARVRPSAGRLSPVRLQTGATSRSKTIS